MLNPALSKNLSIQVLIAMSIGIAFGIFFGEYAAVFKPIGNVYIMLLQSVVYPYLISSLIYGLGNLDRSMALQFLKKGWAIYFGLIVISFCVIYLLIIDIPSPESRIIETNAPYSISHIVRNLIPQNPIQAIANNAIPAVVFLSIFYGISIQGFKNKETLLSVFETIMRASLQIWNWIIFLAPIGVFALFANLAGTTEFSKIKDLAVFLILFFAGSLFLTFLLLPSLISAFSSLSVREILRNLQNAIVISLVTSLSVAALPFIAEATRCFLNKTAPKADKKIEDEFINPALSISYPLCQLGNLFLLLFVFFSLFFFNRSINLEQQLILPVLNFFSAIGTPSTSINAMQFLATSVNLPQSVTELYVTLIPLIRYPQVIASVMGMAFFTVLFSLHFCDQLKVRWSRLFLCAGYIVVFFFAIWGLQKNSYRILKVHHQNLMSFNIDPELRKQVEATVITSKEEAALFVSQSNNGPPSLLNIQKRGVLVVGYNEHMIPWCYFNKNGDLVGYDVAFMYKLASDLHVKLVFVPFEWYDLVDLVRKNAFDIAIGSIYVSAERLEKVAFTDSYFSSRSSLIVKNNEAPLFFTLNDILNNKDVKIAVFKDPVTELVAELNFPKNDIVSVPYYSLLAQREDIDAALWTQAHTDAWVTVHPGYASLVPQGLVQGWPLMMAYMISKSSPNFLEFLNYWLKLQNTHGFSKEQYNHWILREPLVQKNPRWCVARDLLHWID